MATFDYADHIYRKLCWHCHVPTHRSHAQQRQCPQCRRKWSYDRLKAQWTLLDCFCRGLRKSDVVRTFRYTWPTVLAHYRIYEAEILRVLGADAVDEPLGSHATDQALDAALKKKAAMKTRRRELFQNSDALKKHLYEKVIRIRHETGSKAAPASSAAANPSSARCPTASNY